MMNRMRNWLVLDPVDWRAGMLALMLKVATILGVIVCIPSVYLSVKRGLYGIVFIDVTAISVVFALNFLTGLSFRVRSVAFGLVCYSLGTGLLYLVGSVSQIYLMGSSVLITLLLGTGAGLGTVALTTVTLLAMGLTGNVAREPTVPLASNQSVEWWLITLNFTLISHIVVAGVGVALRAIERARENETELRRAQDRDRVLVELQIERMPLAYILTDRDFRCIRWNPAAERIFGFTSDEVLGHKIFDLIIPRSLRAVAEKILEQIRSGRMDVTGEFVNATKSGAPITCEWHNTPMFDNEAKFSGVLSLTFDITARKKLESQLLQSQKMEAIGILAGGIAHDFNNILAAILGNVVLAQQDVGEGHEALISLAQIRQAGVRARGMVQQILAFSRRQVQPMAPLRQTLGPLVDETVALLRASLPAGVQLVQVVADEPIEIACDATQVQQVLMNLCTNAWHALAGQAGRIEVALDRVTIGPGEPPRPHTIDLPAGPYAHLQVSDNGVGMDDTTRARIFEPFFTTKPVGQGTGLGLSVVHGIVAAHQGAITVRSRPGEGSRFDVYLPLVDGPHAPQAVLAADPALQAAAGHGRQVLYVDDDEVMLLMVGQLLSRAGYHVTSLPSVTDALAALRLDPDTFDLVITDFNMPDGSGLDVARAALLQRPDRPVVLSSGYLSDAALAEARAVGVQAILMKEHTVEELPSLVGRLLAPPA